MNKTDESDTEQAIVWSDEFLIGIDELDYEHKRLVDDINKLHRELLDHADMERVGNTLGSIHARMQAHFALEEHVMLSHEYPQYKEHKKEHDQFLDDYTEYMNRFSMNPTPECRKDLETALRKWTICHILDSDKKMSRMVAGDTQIHPNLFSKIKRLID